MKYLQLLVCACTILLAGCGTTKGFGYKEFHKVEYKDGSIGYEGIPLVGGEMNRPGTITLEFYEDGSVKKCVIDAKGQSTTEQVGNLVPAYKK